MAFDGLTDERPTVKVALANVVNLELVST